MHIYVEIFYVLGLILLLTPSKFDLSIMKFSNLTLVLRV